MPCRCALRTLIGRQLNDQIIGCLLAMVVDAMSGVITRRVRHGAVS